MLLVNTYSLPAPAEMSPQANIEQTDYLERCIDKKETLQNIWEALGLYRETVGPCKDPDFAKEDAKRLHKTIKKMAQSFKAGYRNDRERFLADLLKKETFSNQVQELEHSFGTLICDGEQGAIQDELRYKKDTQFLLRCWITRVAVETLPNKGAGKSKRKSKSKASTVGMNEPSNNERSDTGSVRTPPGLNGAASSDLALRAPEVPSMLPPAERCQFERTAAQGRSGDVELAPIAGARSPMTPSKRKALFHTMQPTSGKLQKVTNNVQRSTRLPCGRQEEVYSSISGRNAYSIPVSPAFNFPAFSPGLLQRGQREDTCDTDRTLAVETERTIKIETEVDFEESRVGTQESISDIWTTNHEYDSRSPTAGPSSIYHNPFRQISVIPPSTQEDVDDPEVVQTLVEFARAPDAIEDTDITTVRRVPQPDVSKLGKFQKKQLRLELFKLLLSFLNGINQFIATSYQPEAEERIDHLLKEFWSNDIDAIRSAVGEERYAQLETSWDRWTDMRLLLGRFQRSVGYFGEPGDDWRAYLSTMERVAHAKASIAFVDMKGSETADGLANDIGSGFDDDLATIFDLLTQVEGCDGVDEFGAIRVYNQGLMAWFS